jgi:hypothetical protein
MRILRVIVTCGIVLPPAGLMVADARAQEQARPAATLANPVAAQPLEQLSATLDRSLFSPSRRSVVAPPPVAPPLALPALPPSPPDVVLYGVVMDGETARAVVRVGPEKRLLRAQMGDDIDGWSVAQIDSRKVVLASQDGRFATYRIFTGERTGGDANGGAAPDGPKN